MIRNIVFDLGRVLVLFDPDLFVQRLDLDLEDRKILRREVFGSIEWEMTDRGTLSEMQAYNIITQRIPERLHGYARELLFDWYKPLILVDGMMELTKELKDNGYNLYLLSNASLLQNDYWKDVPCSKYFSGKITSAQEKLTKPDLAIYQRLIDRYSLVPDECIFVDDNAANCEAALRIGMEAIVFFDSQDLRKKLNALGIRC